MYVRPLNLDDALEALSRPGAIVIGGGTKVNATATIEPVVVVDLQALDLGGVDARPGGVLSLGATTTLQDLADNPAVPAAIRETARREAPSTLRTLATVAGCVVTADATSELLAALLVHDAVVVLAGRDGTREVELSVLLADHEQLAGRIITAVTIRDGGTTSVARTARTRADRAIVAAIVRRTPSGDRRVAVTGMGATPLVVEADGDVAAAVGRLEPPGDFRGSTEYRRALGCVLVRRALEEVR